MKKRKHIARRGALDSVAILPHYCDFSCVHASFSPVDVVGACRKEQAVFCRMLQRFNNKNAPCLARLQASDA